MPGRGPGVARATAGRTMGDDRPTKPSLRPSAAVQRTGAGPRCAGRRRLGCAWSEADGLEPDDHDLTVSVTRGAESGATSDEPRYFTLIPCFPGDSFGSVTVTLPCAEAPIVTVTSAWVPS